MGTDDNHNRGVQDESHSKVDGSGRTGDALAVSMKEIETRQHEKHETEMISPLPIFTATVQTVAEAELQTVSIIPTEEVVKAVAHAITLSETDVGMSHLLVNYITPEYDIFSFSVGSAKVSVVQATIVDENEQPLPLQREASMEDEGMFWQTSQGKFKFTLDELPASLQLIHLLLKVG